MDRELDTLFQSREISAKLAEWLAIPAVFDSDEEKEIRYTIELLFREKLDLKMKRLAIDTIPVSRWYEEFLRPCEIQYDISLASQSYPEVHYRFDTTRKKDWPRAFQIAYCGACLKDVQCEYYVGMEYEIGRFVKKNRSEAMKWMSKAALKGHAKALWEYGKKEACSGWEKSYLKVSAEMGFEPARLLLEWYEKNPPSPCG